MLPPFQEGLWEDALTEGNELVVVCVCRGRGGRHSASESSNACDQGLSVSLLIHMPTSRSSHSLNLFTALQPPQITWNKLERAEVLLELEEYCLMTSR